MQRILVTGGAGLVGSHLADRLLAEGHEVIAVDDLSRGTFANVAHLRRHPRFVFVEHDVTLRFGAHVDAVFHLAVPSGRGATELDPVRATVSGVMGTVHALEVAAERGARVVVATAAGAPLAEPDAGGLSWGDGARCAEALAAHFAHVRAVDVRVVRVAGPYGPRMAADGENVVARFVIRALAGERLEIAEVDAAAPAEPLTYVDDAVATLLSAIGSNERVPVVVAPHEMATRRDVRDAILRALEADVHLGRIAASRATAGRAADRVSGAVVAARGHVSPVGLAEGCRRTLRWFEAKVGRPVRPGRASEEEVVTAAGPLRRPAS